MVTNNMNKPNIIVTEATEDTASRVDIFIWEMNYKGNNRKEPTLLLLFFNRPLRIYSMLNDGWWCSDPYQGLHILYALYL